MKSLLLLVVVLAGCDRLFGLEHISAMDSRDARTVDAPRDDARAAIDALVDGSESSIDAPKTPGCPPSYNVTSFGTYHYSTSVLGWTAAQQQCIAERGNYALYTHLVVLGSAAEQGIITQMVSGGIAWVGYNDITSEGTYHWVTDEQPVSFPTATSWEGGAGPQTGNAQTDDCTELLSNGNLQMTACAGPLRGVCECDAFPPDPANY